MSASPTTTGAVLGAATTAGILASGVTNWRVAAILAALILALGFAIIFFAKKRKKQNEES